MTFVVVQDHGQGKRAMCGCILVDFEKLLVINRSAKYKVGSPYSGWLCMSRL